jgi:flagellar basal body-associated protein FliL
LSRPHEKQIEAGWIVVMIILLVMLIIGLVLYIRMGISLDVPRKAPTSSSAQRVCAYSAKLCNLYLGGFQFSGYYSGALSGFV